MKKLELRDTETMESGFPVMKVTVYDDEKDVIIRTGYLSPFRGYCFQVSATKEGQCDCGASPVTGLKHAIMFENRTGSGWQSNEDYTGIGKTQLMGLASLALLKFASSFDAVVPSLQYFNEGVWRDNASFDNRAISEFIDASYQWVQHI